MTDISIEDTGTNVTVDDEGVNVTVGSAQGPAGPQGAQGLKGDTGDTGDTGPPGPNEVTDGVTATDITGIVKGNGAVVSPAQADVDYASAHTHPYIPNALVDAKGDIITATADDTPSRKAVGTGGKILVADPSQSDGLNWIDYLPQNQIGRVSRPFFTYGGSSGTLGLTQNWLYAIAIYIARTETVDRIIIEVTTAYAGHEARLGIYANGADGLPGVLLLDAGTVSMATTGLKEIVINQTLTPGLYHLALHASSTNAQIRSGYCIGSYYGAPYGGAFNTSYGIAYQSLAYGPLPNPFGGPVSFAQHVLLIGLRRSA